MKKKFLKNRELLLGGRHLTLCVDIRVLLCYTIIVPKGAEREEEKMKRYCVRVEYSGFKKVWVEAEDADEAMDLASDEVDGMLPGSYDIDDVDICKMEDVDE